MRRYHQVDPSERQKWSNRGETGKESKGRSFYGYNDVEKSLRRVRDVYGGGIRWGDTDEEEDQEGVRQSSETSSVSYKDGKLRVRGSVELPL